MAALTAIVSPHFDDALLSSWSLLAGAGQVRVVNLFTGAPPAVDGPLPVWDVLTGATSVPERVADRRAEDRAALATLGREAVNLDFVDSMYLPLDRRRWTLAARIGTRVAPRRLARRQAERRLESVYEAVRSEIDAAERVYVPAAIGDHPDHQLARDVGLRLQEDGYTVGMYADLPYCVHIGWPHWVTGDTPDPRRNADLYWRMQLADADLRLGAFEPRVERLDDDARRRKLDALRLYETQYPALSSGGLNLLANPDAVGWEVFLEPSGRA